MPPTDVVPPAGEPGLERELTEPVPLVGLRGRLNPDAVGWSRHPLHDTSRIGRGLVGLGRNKRWDYWAVTTPTHIVAVTISQLDYAAQCKLWVLDRERLTPIDRTVATPFSRGVSLPGSLGDGVARAQLPSLRIEIAEVSGGTRIRAESDRVRLDAVAERPAGHEALGVVVPWSSRWFQYTVKDVARPARGRLTIDGATHELPSGTSWAMLDHGRGRWPRRMDWKWGAAAGVEEGHAIGLQLGGLWTVGTGITENAISVDGRLHKIADELEWTCDPDDWLAPWTIVGERVALRFEPFYDRVAHASLGPVSSDAHQCFGHYRGTVTDDAGQTIPIARMLGWAEYVRNRW